MTMARQRGVEALGMRDLARAVGVSPNAAYRHFAGQRALVLTVAQEAQHRLSRAILARMDTVPADAGPAGRLRAFGLGYIHFAVSEPGWFALTCESREPPPGGEPPAPDAPPPPHRLLLGALDAMVEAGLLTSRSRVDAEWSCWSTVHGFALLATGGPLRSLDAADIARLAGQTVDTLIRGLRAEPPRTAG